MKKDKKYLEELEKNLKKVSSKKRKAIVSKYESIIKEEKSKNRKITDILKELGSPEEVATKEIEIIKSNSFIHKIFKRKNKEIKTNKEKINKKESKEKLTLKQKLNNYKEVRRNKKAFKKIQKDNKKKEKLLKAKKDKTNTKDKKSKDKVSKGKTKKSNKKEKLNIKDKTKNLFNKFKSKFKKKNDLEIVVDEIKEVSNEIKEEVNDELSEIAEITTEKKLFESKKTRISRVVLKILGIILITILLFIWLWISVVFMASLIAYLDGIKFIGICISLFGLDILFLWIIIMINKLIFKRKNRLFVNLVIIILSLILISYGIADTMYKITKVEVIQDVSEKYSMTTKIENYLLPSDKTKKLKINFNSNYDTEYEVVYDKTLKDKVKIELKYYECYYDYYTKRTSNTVYVSLKLDDRDRLSVYLDDLKENKIFDNDELSRYTVKISVNKNDAERLVIGK